MNYITITGYIPLIDKFLAHSGAEKAFIAGYSLDSGDDYEIYYHSYYANDVGYTLLEHAWCHAIVLHKSHSVPKLIIT